MATTAPRKNAAKKAATSARSATARAKAPTDRKPAKTAGPAVRVVNVRGKDWAIEEEVLDDFELLDDLNALDQKDDATRMPAVLRRLLGDQWAAAMDVLRDPTTKRVTVEAGTQFVWDLLQELNPNSSSS